MREQLFLRNDARGAFVVERPQIVKDVKLN